MMKVEGLSARFTAKFGKLICIYQAVLLFGLFIMQSISRWICSFETLLTIISLSSGRLCQVEGFVASYLIIYRVLK